MQGDFQQRLQSQITAAMKSGQRQRVSAFRMLSAALKQRAIDLRRALDTSDCLAILEQQLRQRRQSIAQYAAAGRDDLVAQERFEWEQLAEFRPPPLSDAELQALLEEAIAAESASTLRDLGRVVTYLRPHLLGRADMAAVTQRLKQRLGT